LTRSHHYWSQTIHIACSHGVTFKRVPPKSCPIEQSAKACALAKGAIRKDSAVHVSLSSYSVVKQPGAGSPSPIAGSHQTPHHSTTNDNRTTAGCLSTHLSEELRGAETCLGPGAKAVPRSVRGLYAHASFIVNDNRQQIVASNPGRHGGCEGRETPSFSRLPAALEPQCCDVLS
jgi:hypothetical protein